MAKKPLTRKLVSIEEKEAALEALEQKRVAAPQVMQATPQPIIAPEIVAAPVKTIVQEIVTKAPREVHRFNIELPMELYVDIKGHIDHTGQTLKGFLCMCAREYLKSQK